MNRYATRVAGGVMFCTAACVRLVVNDSMYVSV